MPRRSGAALIFNCQRTTLEVRTGRLNQSPGVVLRKPCAVLNRRPFDLVTTLGLAVFKLQRYAQPIRRTAAANAEERDAQVELIQERLKQVQSAPDIEVGEVIEICMPLRTAIP